MKVTLKIEGMMCPHCEGRVKSAIEGIDGVLEALVSHEKGTACVMVNEGVNPAIIADAVMEQGYKVLGIE